MEIHILSINQNLTENTLIQVIMYSLNRSKMTEAITTQKVLW